MKKLVSYLMVFLFLFVAVPIKAYPVLQCTYWYSNNIIIGQWTTTPKIYRKKLAANSDFPFSSVYNYAITEWTNAGISSTAVSSASLADITCYGGTRQKIESEFGIVIPSNVLGRSFIDYGSVICSLEYQGPNGIETKTMKSVTSATVFIIDRQVSLTTMITNKYKNTFLHELGHAFGWAGHSSSNSDVMYYSNTTVSSLTLRDKRHLCQVFG